MSIRTKALIIILVGFMVLLAFYQTPLMRSARHRTWDYVVRKTASLLKIGNLSVESDVTEQLARLQTENISLHSQLTDYARLKKQLNEPAIDSMRAIPAAVIGRPADTFRLQLIISKGVRDGVTMGAPVVTSGKTLIGFVTDVTPQTSTVQLLMHPQTNLTVEVSADDPDKPAARGLLKGQHYTSLVINTIPRDVNITSGQAVITVANDMIPFGLFIGTLSDVKAAENEPYQEAAIRIPYDPDVIDAVNVLVLP